MNEYLKCLNELKKFYELAPKEVIEPIQVLPWVDISNEIMED